MVAGWEAWHQSQKRQKRQQRQQALRAPPDVMMRSLFNEWGVSSVQSLKLDERHSLAAGLAAAISALLGSAPPPPPGLTKPA
jgi:hypothetical protein